MGCIELYKLTTLEERHNFLRERKACFRCGVSPYYVKDGKHRCDWRRGKISGRCTGRNDEGFRCGKAAAMCNNHSENAMSELLSWLQDCKVKFTVNIIVTDMNLLRQNLSPEHRAAWLNKNQESQNSNVSREILQKGRSLTNDD